MNNIYKYDRAMAYSSVYILIPAYYASRPSNIIMIFQTLFSIFHWKYYFNRVFHNIDTILSTYTFIYHLLLLRYNNQDYYRNIALIYATLAILVFYNRKGYRERAIKEYRIIYIVPHALFRYLAFWFVMSVYNHEFDILISIMYWSSIIGLAYF